MRSKTEMLVAFKELDIVQQENILNILMQEHELNLPVIESAKEDALNREPRKPCPHCKSISVSKRGFQNNQQMYSCKDCKKWYSQSTGTPLWGIKLKQKWSTYVHCMNEGYSLRKSAEIVGICIQTSFDWRHKILASLNSLVPQSLSGVLECDELELSINNKGERGLKRSPRKRSTDFSRNQGEGLSVVQVVTAVERNGDKLLKVVETKRLTSGDITKVLEGKVTDGTILITDKHPSYKSFGRGHKELKHKTVRASEHVNKNEKNVHLQSVNQTHAQVRKFLGSFNGVRTKYLQNYLNWYAYKGKLIESKKVLKQWVITGMLSPTAYNLFLLFKENAVNVRT